MSRNAASQLETQTDKTLLLLPISVFVWEGSPPTETPRAAAGRRRGGEVWEIQHLVVWPQPELWAYFNFNAWMWDKEVWVLELGNSTKIQLHTHTHTGVFRSGWFVASGAESLFTEHIETMKFVVKRLLAEQWKAELPQVCLKGTVSCPNEHSSPSVSDRLRFKGAKLLERIIKLST